MCREDLVGGTFFSVPWGWGNKKIKKWFCRDLIQGRQGVIIEASSEVFIFSLLPVDKVYNSVDLLGEEMVDGDLQ